MTGWFRRRAERREAAAAQLREREALVSAADWSITSARAWYDARTGEAQWVTVADVVARAREDEGVEVTSDAAAAVLRERLELRGRFFLRTDAYLDADGIDRRGQQCVHCTDDAVTNWPGVGPVCDLHGEMHDHFENPGEPDEHGIISSVVHDTNPDEFGRWMKGNG